MYLKIAEVADVLKVSEIDARVLMKFHGVETKDGEQVPGKNGKIFGKAPKLYLESDVKIVKGYKK